MAFSPDGRLVAAGGLDDSVVLYEAATGNRIRTLNCFDVLRPRRRVAAITFSPDGQPPRLRELGRSHPGLGRRDRSESPYPPTPTGQPVPWRLALTAGASPPRAVRLVGSFEGELKLWDFATGSELFGLRGHVGVVLCVAFSPDGRRLASAGVDRRIRVWDTATGQPILALAGHEQEIRTIVFSPDGTSPRHGGPGPQRADL